MALGTLHVQESCTRPCLGESGRSRARARDRAWRLTSLSETGTMAFLAVASGGASDSVIGQCGGLSCVATHTDTMAFQNNVLLLPKELDEKVTKNALFCTRLQSSLSSVVKLAPQERVQKRTAEQRSSDSRGNEKIPRASSSSAGTTPPVRDDSAWSHLMSAQLGWARVRDDSASAG